MADPSLLLSGEGLEWLERNADARERLIVPRAFVDWLVGGVDLDPALVLSPEDAPFFDERRGYVAELVSEVPSFSHLDGTLRAAPHEEVRMALLLDGGPLAELHADEWTFLQSRSTMFSKTRRPLEAFRDAGAAIVEIGRKTGSRLLQRVIPREHLPDSLTRKVLATAAVKWIVLGGATIGGGTLGGLAGAALGGPAGGFVGGKVAGFGAGAATNAALLAIDP